MRGEDGRYYSVASLVLNFYGNLHTNRKQARLQRFHENMPYMSLTNNPRGFGVQENLAGTCTLAKGDYVLFACKKNKRGKKNAIRVGKVLWFKNHYWVKTKKYSHAMAHASCLEDDVWVKCF